MQHICLRHSLMFVYTGRRRNKDLLLLLLLLLLKDVQATTEAITAQKRTSSTSKHEIY